MRIYLVFYGNKYYPHGGMLDHIGDFDRLPEAKRYLESIFIQHSKALNYEVSEIFNHRWGHIYDQVDRKHYELRYEEGKFCYD